MALPLAVVGQVVGRGEGKIGCAGAKEGGARRRQGARGGSPEKFAINILFSCTMASVHARRMGCVRRRLSGLYIVCIRRLLSGLYIIYLLY